MRLVHVKKQYNTLFFALVLSCPAELLSPLSQSLNDVYFYHCLYLISKSFSITNDVINWLVTKCASFLELDQILSNHDANGALNGWCFPVLSDIPWELMLALLGREDSDMEGKTGCQLLFSNVKPDLENLNSLPLKANAAYVFYEDSLWYINKLRRECIEFNLPKRQHDKEPSWIGFLKAIYKRNGADILPTEAFEAINSCIVKHDHYESIVTYNQSRQMVENLRVLYLNNLAKLSYAGCGDKRKSDIDRLFMELMKYRLLSLNLFQYIIRNPSFILLIDRTLRAAQNSDKNRATLEAHADLIMLFLRYYDKHSGPFIRDEGIADSMIDFFRFRKDVIKEMIPPMILPEEKGLILYCIWKLHNNAMLLPEYLSIISSGGDIKSKIDLIFNIVPYMKIRSEFIGLIATHPQPHILLNKLSNLRYGHVCRLIRDINELFDKELDRAQIIEKAHVIVQLKRNGVGLFQLPIDILAIIAGHVSEHHSPNDAGKMANKIFKIPGIFARKNFLEIKSPIKGSDTQGCEDKKTFDPK